MRRLMGARRAFGVVGVLFLGVLARPGLAAETARLGVNTPPAKAAGAIRLASYNILNLFDDRDDPSLSGRFDDWFDRDNGLRAKPQDQQRAVAEAIRRLDADVIGLQEIESFDALIDFREKHLAGLGYDHVVSIDVGQERGIEQAVLSRFPIKEATVWPTQSLGGMHPEKVGSRVNELAGQPIDSRRSPLRVVIEVPAERTGGAAYEFILFVTHHKSGFGYDYWREREVARLMETIREMQSREPSRNIAVVGDFNARPQDRSVQMYSESGMIDTLADRAEGDPRFLTHESDRTIDFIFVNSAMSREVIEKSAFVLGTPLRPKGADWRTTPTPEGFAADHLPVSVDIMPRDK